jgi:hypothetical protein
MNEEWWKQIRAKLAIAESKGLIDEADIPKYENAIRLGQAQAETRSFTQNKPLSEYLQDRVYMSTGDAEDIEGWEQIENNIVSRGIVEPSDIYNGFAVQLYQAAEKGDIILFPQDVDLMAKPAYDLEKSEKATRVGETGEEYRRIIAERLKRAMYTYDSSDLQRTYGFDNIGGTGSALKTENLKSRFVDWVDNIGETPEMITYRKEKNYINDFVKFLDKGSKDVDELYSTGDFAFKFNKSVQGTQALLEALGLDKFSSNVAEQVGNKLSQIAREKGITNRLKLMDELEAQVGEDVLTKSGLRLYSPEIIQLAQEYGSRYFSGFSSPKEKAVGIAINPINVTM